MSIADQIRHYVIQNQIEPARAKGHRYVIVHARDVHEKLNLVANFPNICQTLDGQIFIHQANVRLVERSGPKESSTVEWVFSV